MSKTRHFSSAHFSQQNRSIQVTIPAVSLAHFILAGRKCHAKDIKMVPQDIKGSSSYNSGADKPSVTKFDVLLKNKSI